MPDPNSSIVIRRASSMDAGAIASLHTLSWQAAYQDILPAEYLRKDLQNEHRQYWASKMQDMRGGDFVLLAACKDRLVGFVSVSEREEGDCQALLEHLHVLPSERASGIGSALFLEVSKQLAVQGKTRFYLWVFDQNRSAIVFYEKWSGTRAGSHVIEIAGEKIPETRYAFDVSQLGRRQ
jgi:GNAT superfamily N-acetyltransferase